MSQSDLLSSVIYLLGGVGLLGITLLPLRSYLILQACRSHWATDRSWRVMFGVVAMCSVLAHFLAGEALARVVVCLTQPYCGPNVASGWFYLAYVGFAYLAFELTAVLASQVRARLARAAL